MSRSKVLRQLLRFSLAAPARIIRERSATTSYACESAEEISKRILAVLQVPLRVRSIDFRRIFTYLPRLATNLHESENYVSGAFVGGTTGERWALSPDEHVNLITHWAEVAGADLRVIAQVGRNDLKESLKVTERIAVQQCVSGIGIMLPELDTSPPGLKDSLESVVKWVAKIAASAPETGDVQEAEKQQAQLRKNIEVMTRNPRVYFSALKHTMRKLGVDCGPVRETEAMSNMSSDEFSRFISSNELRRWLAL